MPHSGTNTSFRELVEQELIRISEIDRSEEILEQYVVVNGKLVLSSCSISSSGFDPKELAEIIGRQHKILEQKGFVFGAFNGEKLIGVASLENRKRGAQHDYLKMDILYVSNTYRVKGVGSQLLNNCKEKALRLGAEKLYVSATPTQTTVDFYLKHGATLTSEIDSELYKLEPDDIHLELSLLV